MTAGHEMRIVLDVAGHANGEDYGYRRYAGSFMRALCQAIFTADRANRAKLRVVFPDLVDAVDHYETRPRSLWLADADLRSATSSAGVAAPTGDPSGPSSVPPAGEGTGGVS